MRKILASGVQRAEAHDRAFETGLLNYSQDQANALAAALVGSVVTPFDPNYATDRMAFMHTYQHYPQIIVHCATIQDVTAALAFAKTTSLKVTTRSGGHSTAGYSVNDQLVIDMTAFDNVSVDAARRIARVGAGTNFRKLNQELEAAGLHVPGGGCETVCVAGYMQGGGYGFTSRLFGLHCDSVRGVTLVLADGSVVHAAPDGDPDAADLYWALRGGTGNQFGVVVEIEYDLHPLDTLWGYGLKWPLGSEEERAHAAVVLATYQAGFTSSADAPGCLGHQVLLMNLPTPQQPAGQIPQLLMRGVCLGTEDDARAALQPLIALMADPKTQIEIWESGRYMQLNEILLETVDPPGMDMPTVSLNTQALVDGRIVNDIHGDGQWRQVIDLFLDAPALTTFIAMESYGGAVNAPAPTDTAFVHRRDSLDLFTWVFWTFEADGDSARAWLDRFGELGDEMGSGRRYQNYPLRGNPDFRTAYFGENFDRLLAIKQRVDPGCLFAYEQSLTPAPGGATAAN